MKTTTITDKDVAEMIAMQEALKKWRARRSLMAYTPECANRRISRYMAWGRYHNAHCAREKQISLSGLGYILDCRAKRYVSEHIDMLTHRDFEVL